MNSARATRVSFSEQTQSCAIELGIGCRRVNEVFRGVRPDKTHPLTSVDWGVPNW